MSSSVWNRNNMYTSGINNRLRTLNSMLKLSLPNASVYVARLAKVTRPSLIATSLSQDVMMPRRTWMSGSGLWRVGIRASCSSDV